MAYSRWYTIIASHHFPLLYKYLISRKSLAHNNTLDFLIPFAKLWQPLLPFSKCKGRNGHMSPWNPVVEGSEVTGKKYLCLMSHHMKLTRVCNIYASSDILKCELYVCAQLCLTLCDPMHCSLPGASSMGFPRQNSAVGFHFPLQEIFLTQGSNPHLLNGSWILYHCATWEAL